MPEVSNSSTELDATYSCIDALITYAQHSLKLDPRDADLARNEIFALFSLDSYTQTEEGAATAQQSRTTAQTESVDELLARFTEAATTARIMEPDEAPRYEDAVMGILTARPSALQDEFASIERSFGGDAAMDWFYQYCVSNTYVKKSALDKNPRFDSHNLVVTINLAKPEFKNMKKAAAGNSVGGGYPKCTICHENEGFGGRNKRTLRTVPLTLGGDPWFWQYSPYGYFHQHGICVNSSHEPMHVDRATFGHLLDFVDAFPSYFLGCNAALPRIGGSVLAHDHYQGGGEMLPMHKATAWASYSLEPYPDATIEILEWPGTAVRVVSRSRSDIVEISDRIRQAWVAYDNADLGIASHDEEGNRQSALSPSVVITSRGYEMSLIFRNNAVSEEFPEGIFHAHPQFWPIKQEPIGLIEAQGLFILPGRLVRQLEAIERALYEGADLPEEEKEFSLEWDEIRAALCDTSNGDDSGKTAPSKEAIHEAVRDELGSICERILRNTAVFKHKESTAAFLEENGFHAHTQHTQQTHDRQN
jgi:UDPglucose--hexose-1-phosphate uridylyltransferase